MYIWAESKPTSERVFLDKQWILGRAGLAGFLLGIWLEQNTNCVGRKLSFGNEGVMDTLRECL